MSQSPQIEAWLRYEGTPYKYNPQFRVADIDVRTSLANQARLTVPLDGRIVERYALAAIDGADFPPIILHNRVVIDGNHRVAAFKALDFSNIEAYVLLDDVDATVVSRLTRTANIMNGIPPSPDEVLVQAKWLVTHGMLIATAAKTFRISKGVLERAIARDRSAARLANLGFAVEKFADSVLSRFDALRSDEALSAVAAVVMRHSLGFDAVATLIPRVRQQLTVPKMLEEVQRFADSPDIKGRTPTSRVVQHNPAKARYFRILTEMHSYLRKYATADAVGFTTEERTRAVELWNDTQLRLGMFLRSNR